MDKEAKDKITFLLPVTDNGNNKCFAPLISGVVVEIWYKKKHRRKWLDELKSFWRSQDKAISQNVERSYSHEQEQGNNHQSWEKTFCEYNARWLQLDESFTGHKRGKCAVLCKDGSWNAEQQGQKNSVAQL